MKILHIYKDFEPTLGGGGVARHIEGLCSHLVSKNDVTVAAFICELRTDKIRTEILTYKRLPHLIDCADVIHVHGARTLCALLAGMAAAAKNKPFFYTPHCYYEDKNPFKKLMKKAWDCIAERFLLRYSHTTFLLAPSWINYVKKHIAPAHNIVIVPNCINESAVKILPRATNTSNLEGEPAILYVGRLDSVKCLDHVITAMTRASLKFAILHVVGKGPDYGRLEKLATINGIAKRVKFYGFQDDDAVAHLASRADVFVLPSAQEGLPTVLLEMLLRHLPVVASDIAGNMAIMEPLALEACTYPFGDIDALAATIATVAADGAIDEFILKKLRSIFTWDVQANNIEDQYRASLS